MSKLLLLLAAVACMALSCNNNNGGHDNGNNNGKDSLNLSDVHEYITLDSANKMLQSYLTSIDAEHNDSELRSITIDADQLRIYLHNKSVKKMKIMLAHTLDYANSTRSSKNCGYLAKDLTVVIAGYDSDENYVYVNNKVLDLGTPCPASCPTRGSAASNVLPVIQHK